MTAPGPDLADSPGGGPAGGAPAPEGGAEPAPFPGPAMELGSNRPFPVEADGVWFIERGEVDLFSVARAAGAPAGQRIHLLRIPSGRLLLGLGSPGDRPRDEFQAVPTNGSRLLRGSW